MRAVKSDAMNSPRKSATWKIREVHVFRLAVEHGIFCLSLEKAKTDSISLKGFRKYVLRDSYD